MKKSEAVVLIVNHYSCFTNGCSTSQEAVSHAEALLEKLTDKGMSPPEVGVFLGKEFGRYWEEE